MGLPMRRCTSAAPAARTMRTNLRLVVPRTIESSTRITFLSLNTLRSGLNFNLTPSSRSGWSALMKVPTDVMVAHQAELEGQAAGLGVAQGHRVGGIRHRHHNIAAHGVMRRQPGAEALAHVVAALAEGDGVGAAEVHMLEDAMRRPIPVTAQGRQVRMGKRPPCGPNSTTSPGSNSPTRSTRLMSRALVSLATTHRPCEPPKLRGRMAWRSRTANMRSKVIRQMLYAPWTSACIERMASRSGIPPWKWFQAMCRRINSPSLLPAKDTPRCSSSARTLW